jgi:rod shape-determining protein MreC
MFKFFRSKFFIITLCIALAISIGISVLALSGNAGVLKSAAGAIVLPFRYAINYTTNAISGFHDYFSTIDTLIKENERLKAELKTHSENSGQLSLLKEENEWLKGYLSIKRNNPTLSMSDAMIISREAGAYFSALTLDKGSAVGVSRDMPVITDSGILGSVTEVGLTYCKVVTLLDPSSSVGGYVERSGATGLVSGSFELKDSGICVMKYLADDADIVIGDRILSSGMGSVYPRGLLIGEVVSVTPDEFGRELSAEIAVAVDFNDLSRAMIITGNVNE